MWLGYTIHEENAIQGGKAIMEKGTNKDSRIIGTPPSEVNKLWALRHASPWVPQLLYLNGWLDVVSSHHLHFTQLPRQEKIECKSSLFEGFHITIQLKTGFKGITNNQVKGACLERLCQMDTPKTTCGPSHQLPILPNESPTPITTNINLNQEIMHHYVEHKSH